MAEYDDDIVGLSSMMMEDAQYQDEQQQLEEQNRQRRLQEQHEEALKQRKRAEAKAKLAARMQKQSSVSASRCQAVWHLKAGNFTYLIRQANSRPTYGCLQEAVGNSKYWNNKKVCQTCHNFGRRVHGMKQAFLPVIRSLKDLMSLEDLEANNRDTTCT